MTSSAAAHDIVPDSHDVALGEGWFPPERYRGVAFRWVENDAVVHVAALRAVNHTLRVVVEPGPGVGLRPFVLSARDAGGAEIGKAVVSSKQVIKFPLPPETPRVHSIVLHGDGGGKASPNDPRVLNFRVFELSVERIADVFPPWAQPADGFYPLEHHAGSVFRWVGGDASVTVHPAHGASLEFDAESGPGLESKPFTLHVAGPDGSDLVTAQIASRTIVRVPLGALDGAASLTLRSEGGGRALRGDPRTLNYRVFAR
jgi:hypothetical protein